jgi:hypothetical protein
MTDGPAHLIRVRELDERFESRRALARAALRGNQVRIGRGAYVAANDWQRLAARDQYLLRIRAYAEAPGRSPVLSHWSAAAIHGLPIIGEWPQQPHRTAGPAAGGRSSANVVRHSALLRDDDVVEMNGLLVTSIARTTLDLAVASNLVSAVTTADSALFVDPGGRVPARLRYEDLLDCYARRMPFRGHRLAMEVISFAETGAQTPIESVSRVSMWKAGAPRPVLQQAFHDHLGLIGRTDFDFPLHALVGESDGDMKYLDPRFRAGRSAEQVVLDEKRREDRLRAIGRRVSRWGWGVASHPDALRRHLAAAGLPMGAAKSGW